MVGGFQGDPDTLGNARFTSFSSAIDISGGIFRKPAIRVLTGSHYGSLVKSDNSNNSRDSLIIGNTDPNDFSGANTESIIIGEQAEIKGAQNSIVQGSSNTILDISNSLVIGKGLAVGQSGTTMDGVVALGEGPVTINGDDRIVFATNDGTSSMKALTVDKNGNVKIAKNLEVEGDIILENDETITNSTDGTIVIDGKTDFNDNALTGYGADLQTESGTTKTLAAADNGTIIVCSSSSAVTITVPSSLPSGFNCMIIQNGSGQVSLSASSTTLNNRNGSKTAGQYAILTLVHLGSDLSLIHI